jgi:hypothetical protein
MSDEARHDELEPGGVATRKVTLLAFAILLFLAASMGGLYVTFIDWTPVDRTPSVKVFPRPRQEAEPAKELHALLAKQHGDLTSYRWIDTARKRVAIPIDRAMQIIAQRGQNAFDPLAGEKQ